MSVTLPRAVVETMASREHRLHHWLWHEVRNNWLFYPEDVQKTIREFGWEPPRPALDQRRRPQLDNDAGEDFLYMHRQMLVDVSRILAGVNDPNYPRVQVWTVPPPPGDEQWPVPPAWFDPTAGADQLDRRNSFEGLQRVKSDSFYFNRMMTWQRMFTDPAHLRGMSLGRLGALIEVTIHASMHVRWSSPPHGSRPEPGPDQGHTIDTRWDDPRYDYLGDTYSSHVNPAFWSLHAWVDDRIEDWKAANGVFGNDFWKGTWVGKMPIDTDEAVATQPPARRARREPREPARRPHAGPRPHRVATGTATLGHENPRAVPPGVHALMEGPGHRHSHKDELEELVTVVGECGIFAGGYASRFFPTID